MKRWTIALLLVVSACSASADDVGPTTPRDEGAATETTAAAATSSPSSLAGDAPVSDPNDGSFDGQAIPGTVEPVVGDWDTDFGRATIDLNELRVGIPSADPRDLIRPIDEPIFEPVGESSWLADVEPGVVVEIDGDARFYPLGIMTRHEVVNDVVGDRPAAVTYCPLCNTALAFDPVVEGQTLRFGVSGLLRNSDLVMWDDATESLWQQITGEAIVGELAGTALSPLPSRILQFADFAESFPDGQVMAEEQGFGIPYGANPYAGYSSRTGPIGAFVTGDIDDTFPAMERVVGVTTDGQDKAYPFSILAEERAVNDTVGGEPVVVLWGAADTADALDGFQIAESNGIGTGVAYLATVDGQVLTMEPAGGDRFEDAETSSTWTLLGQAVDGPLAGTQLEVLPHRNEFWFAWSVFFPEGDVYPG